MWLAPCFGSDRKPLIVVEQYLTQNFEPEQGQRDGTLAHALSGCLAWSQKGYKIASDSHEINFADSFSFHFDSGTEFDKLVQLFRHSPKSP
jgi:hypothetical protein